jgi:hypothetical protein
MNVALFMIDAAGRVSALNRHARQYGVKWWVLPFVGMTRDYWVMFGMFLLAVGGAIAFWEYFIDGI